MYHNFRSNLQRASGDTASSSGQDCTVGGHCELQPPQRFSLQDVQASAGLPLPSRPAPQAPSQHPSSSRLQAAHGKSTGHASAQPMPEQASSISHALASQLLSQTYQAQYEHGPGYVQFSYPNMAAYGPLYAAHHQMPYQQAPRSGMQPLGLHQSHTQHQQQQQQQYMHYVSEPVMVCEESWPWDDNLLDSPGSDSFESASTTYDPPSDESIPESYSSSTASTAALIPAHAPYTTSGCQQSRFEVQQLVRPPQLYARSSGVPAVCKPPLAPATCQPFQASEHRRVPRPRFRASNPPRISMKAKRNLLADLEAVNDDIDLHFNVDYAFRSSSLIKAVAMPTRHTLRGQAKGPCKARQAMAKYSPHSYPVHFADMDWQEDDSAQVALEMGGMSIDLDFPDKEISGGRSTGPYPEAANTDSMFAWLSKLLPGL